MARLIPPLFPEGAAPGEKSVYRKLAEDQTTDDWIVLHSLNIAEHVRNRLFELKRAPQQFWLWPAGVGGCMTSVSGVAG